MALDQYEGPGEVQYNNSTLAQATSISVNNNGNNNPVTTMKLGLAGRSKGAPTVDISVDNAVPKVGLEAEFIQAVHRNEDVTITHLFAGRRYVYDVWLDGASITQGTDAPASISFECMGKLRTIV